MNLTFFLFYLFFFKVKATRSTLSCPPRPPTNTHVDLLTSMTVDDPGAVVFTEGIGSESNC